MGSRLLGVGPCPSPCRHPLLVLLLGTRLLWMVTPTPAPVPQVNGFVLLTFSPLPLRVTRGGTAIGWVNATIREGVPLSTPLTLHVCCHGDSVTHVVGESVSLASSPVSVVFNVTVTGLVLGKSAVRFFVITKNASSSRDVDGNDIIYNLKPPVVTDPVTSHRFKPDADNTWETSGDSGTRLPEVTSVAGSDVWWLPWEYPVVVVRAQHAAEVWVQYGVLVLVAVSLVGIGGQLDAGELLDLLRAPRAVSAAFCCRFGLMPALGLGLVELLHLSHTVSLGVLTLLTSPAEGASCLLVLLLEGDVTCSVTMTTVCNFATVAMWPLWTILFETRIYDHPGHVQIPFRETFGLFGCQLVAVAVGHYLSRRAPKLYGRCWLYLPALTVLTLLLLFALEIYNNSFIFPLITLQIFWISALLAATGYIFGAAVAFVARQPVSRITAIAIETGCRTSYMTCLLLGRTLGEPEGDVARAAPVVYTMLSVLPAAFVVLVIRGVRRRREAGYAPTECSFVEGEGEEGEEEEEGTDGPGLEEGEEVMVTGMGVCSNSIEGELTEAKETTM